MEEKLAQLQAKLEAEQGFSEKLFSLETPEEVQSLLKEQGLEFTLEEIATIGDSIVKALEKGETGELSEESLDGVAGGVFIRPFNPGFPITPIYPPINPGNPGRW